MPHASDADRDITFVVQGVHTPADASRAPAGATVRASVSPTTTRAGAEPIRLSARIDRDVVRIAIADGPTLVLHPESARDLFRAQASTTARAALAATPDEVVVPAQLAWPGAEAGDPRRSTRGGGGQVILDTIDVITDVTQDLAADLVTAAVTAKLDGQVDEGVYKLSANELPPSLKKSTPKAAKVPAAKDGGPILVLVHGTFVDTASTFGKLWSDHGGAVRELFAHYDDRVYALDHKTLGVSPIANALSLVQAMPTGARIHLLTHSRGGLVAEALVRACSGQPLREDELALFDGEGYAAHQADLKALVAMARKKAIRVERVVRVACPARGTLLASRRLDAYLSVLQWGLELANIPVLPELVAFLHEVARRRADPAVLPGLEAMTPDSPVVAWLNSASEPMPGDLRVIAGDVEGDSIRSWVKTLLADAFFWADNDLVVQTRSMYGGAPRQPGTAGGGATFLLDRGADVTHFAYFANERTVTALKRALVHATPVDFDTIGPLSWAGEDDSGTRAAKAVARSRGGLATPREDRPAVFVLPGILGSNLALDNKRIWLGFRFVNQLRALAWRPDAQPQIEPDGPIGMVYDRLLDRLAESHEVIPFAFDWRRPIEDEARRLAAAVDAQLAVRAQSRKPVRLLAHSMGGLVARTMHLECPDTWAAMMEREGARVLMLGTPNAGSWAPMQVLSTDDTFGNVLSAIGSLFDGAASRRVMAGMPGFLQLQAGLLDPKVGLGQESTWRKLADDDMAAVAPWIAWHHDPLQRGVYTWGVPSQAVLDQARTLRHRLDEQVRTWGADADKVVMVLGRAPLTPCGFETEPDGFTYLHDPDTGDGRVTRQSALLPGVTAWELDAAHSKLPEVAHAFDAYVELLNQGATGKLRRVPPLSPSRRGGDGGGGPPPAQQVRRRGSRAGLGGPPPSSESDLWREDSDPSGLRPTRTALDVSVLNGDLTFVRQPLLIGHYRSMTLTGAERVLDRLVGGRMSVALKAGIYPDGAGTHQVFDNASHDPSRTLDTPRPCATIVVGLGEEGKLRGVDLAFTVRQAILAYAQRFSERTDAPRTFELATTLMASGGPGFSAGNVAQAIVQGALDANHTLVEVGWPVLGRLTLVELFLDRASEAWRAVKQHEAAAPGRLRVDGRVTVGKGALPHMMDSSYRGASYDLISALSVKGKDDTVSHIAFTLDTKRARTEVRAQHTQSALVRELVRSASNDANADPQIGRTLFNLIVPAEVEPFLSGSTEMVIEVDEGSAVIPWELLDANPDPQVASTAPWALRAKLLRKFRTSDFKAQVRDAGADHCVLVIGEPACDPKSYPPLPGARREAREVKALLERLPDRDKVRALIDDNDAQDIINALYERPYRAIHVAGHGAPTAQGGVVLSGQATYLGVHEIAAMRVAPELVFLNCCHLAARDASTTLVGYDRAEFAATVAEALIKAGVRCVIAAGWAVEDIPAAAFATTFYRELLDGARFIDAVGAARSASWDANPRGNTWAAYQCYGDPDWTWRTRTPRTQRTTTSQAGALAAEFAGVASYDGLKLALDTLTSDGTLGRRAPDVLLARLGYLEAEFSDLWGHLGFIAEAFGAAYASAGDVDHAIAWCRRAVQAPDGSASFRACERLATLQVLRGEQLDDVAQLQEGIDGLLRLVAVGTSCERQTQLGSAYKRLSTLLSRAGHTPDATAALTAAVEHYAAAEAMTRTAGAEASLHDPALQRIRCELRAAFLSNTSVTLDPARVSAVRASLTRAVSTDPDLVSVAGLTELRILEALATRSLAGVLPSVLEELRDLARRVSDKARWAPVVGEARFTLAPYVAASHAAPSPAERSAATSLLEAWEALATG